MESNCDLEWSTDSLSANFTHPDNNFYSIRIRFNNSCNIDSHEASITQGNF